MTAFIMGGILLTVGYAVLMFVLVTGYLER